MYCVKNGMVKSYLVVYFVNFRKPVTKLNLDNFAAIGGNGSDSYKVLKPLSQAI